jgi:hypothetical protein
MKRSALLVMTSLLVAGSIGGCGQIDDSSPAPYASVVPPSRGEITAATGEVRWFAIDTLSLGVRAKDTGLPRTDAWKDFGFDLDARNTTAEQSIGSVGSCRRRVGSPSKGLEDGHGGIDNNFGAHLVPLLRSVSSDFEEATARDLSTGRYALLLRLEQVGPENNARVPGALFLASKPGSKPTFGADDHFAIDARSLVDGISIDRPLVTFPEGYMVSGTWVSGHALGAIAVPFTLGEFVSRLPIDSGIVSVHVADGSAGTIAGAIAAPKLETAAASLMNAFGFCPDNATGRQVLATFTTAADLVADAPGLQDENRECDAVSVGVGFTMKPTGAPTVVAPPEAPIPDACAPTTGV